MNFENYFLNGQNPYPLRDSERAAVEAYKALVEAQGPLWDDKFLIKGQVGVGILKHFLKPEQSFVVTGRVFSKRIAAEGFILHIGDATGTMFLLNGSNANERTKEVARLVSRGDLVTAHVETIEKPGRQPQVMVMDMYCIGKTFHHPQYATKPRVDECILRAITDKLVRTFLNQQGFLEVPNDSHSPQRDHNAYHLMLGFPKVYSIKDSHLMVNAYHHDAEDLRRLLQLMVNTIQVGTEIRIWEPELPIFSLKDGKKKKEPRWIKDIPKLGENPNWRHVHFAKEGPEFQHKFELKVAGNTLGVTEENAVNLLDFTKHIHNGAYRYEGYLYEGIPPFATMTFELDDFVKCLTESPKMLYNQNQGAETPQN